MTQNITSKELLAIREHSLNALEEYIKLIDILGGEDETLIQTMFLGFAAESIFADRVTYYFFDEGKKKLYPNVLRIYKDKKLVPYDYYSDLKDIFIKSGEDTCGVVAQTKTPLFIENVGKDKRYSGIVDKKIKLNIHSIICFPLIIHENLYGVIEVATLKNNRPLTNSDYYVISIIVKITMTIMEKMKLYKWSITDNLTQVYNYQFLQISLEKELARAKRYPNDVGVIMMDIDNFKELNDKYGHVFGNSILQGLARIINNSIRKNIDLPIRYGGDEFLLLLPETDLVGAKSVAKRLLERASEEKFITDQQEEVHATLSIGVTAAHKDQVINKDKLIKKADDAMYKAKRQGKNRISITN
ncbi:MAG: sensor domain-containing diguanylate cyclase [Spirochaetes bacterium]|nr:sensor domain-containing diguanylate cyclase [Spirochaetota bacterium]